MSYEQIQKDFSIKQFNEIMHNLGFQVYKMFSFEHYYFSLFSSSAYSTYLVVEGKTKFYHGDRIVVFDFYKMKSVNGVCKVEKVYCENVRLKKMLRRVVDFLIFLMEVGYLQESKTAKRQIVELERWLYVKDNLAI
ncbi:hypothetical protein [Pilibacter termitis]|uniref:hypothetical protein n=1 Tax=Pilibacter termitis TaxID=263852 RepID=UPI001184CF42|nr:hypothetical protein [Pilibacter termitis]